jgi:hypothetical protein
MAALTVAREAPYAKATDDKNIGIARKNLLIILV